MKWEDPKLEPLANIPWSKKMQDWVFEMIETHYIPKGERYDHPGSSKFEHIGVGTFKHGVPIRKRVLTTEEVAKIISSGDPSVIQWPQLMLPGPHLVNNTLFSVHRHVH
jgi:hypothetical protein